MRRVDRLLLLLLLTSVFSCKKALRPHEYAAYVESADHGLVHKSSVSGMEYVMQYRPYEYVILRENISGFTDGTYVARLRSLKGTAWFNISFRLVDGSMSPLRFNLKSREEYDQRYSYYLNQAVQDIRLVFDRKDTIKPMSYLFENNYNLTPQETIVVGFDLPRGIDYPTSDMQLCFEDVVFKNGIIKSLFKSDDLNNIPKLKY